MLFDVACDRVLERLKKKKKKKKQKKERKREKRKVFILKKLANGNEIQPTLTGSIITAETR